MNYFRHLFLTVLMLTSQILSPMAFAADTSIATLNISGNVPTIFSVTARGYPGDLDLSGDVAVNDRLIGIFHFKYNVDIASLTLQSAETDGVPSSSTAAGDAYAFDTTSFRLKFGACTTIHATYKAAFNPLPAGVNLGAGVDIKDAATTAGLTAGREEDCDLTATWTGNTSSIPLAGKYSLSLTLTMVSI